MTWKILLLLNCLTVLLLSPASCVDRGNFKTCNDARFCKKHRELKSDDHIHELLVDSVTASSAGTSISGTVKNLKTNDELLLEVYGVRDRTVRIKLNELNPSRKRYEVEMSLDGTPDYVPIKMEKQHGQIQLLLGDTIHLTLHPKPFRIDVYEEGTLLSMLNADNLLLIEPMRVKPGFVPEVDEKGADHGEDHVEEENHEGGNEVKDEETKQDDAPAHEEERREEPWEETFKGHVDSKPFGPNSIGLDVSFIGFDNLYGIPEHADSLRLRSTKANGDPYRLYNLDVFEYELNNPMALYGAIPFIIAHSEKHTLGMFWNNAAETWIDIDYTTTSTGGSTMFGDSSSQPKADTHWISETGIIDIFLFIGPKPADVSRQFTTIVGHPYLPPHAAIGYHQCRWNYNDQKDVQTVHENFDHYDIPMDVMWLDIEYTDGKRYFTWDAPKFANPDEMIKNLTKFGRNLVVISDPHFKKDDNYFVYKDLKDKDFCVKSKDGGNFEGWCWPGASYYPDFINPAVRDWYAELYSRETFKDAWTWNDMNEPSVFNGPEVTMHKDNIHIDGLEHREVHNIYGMAHVMASFDGHLKRHNYQLRPFILTRSFFAGSQRHAAVWTGDNTADWNHLKIAAPMLLSLNIAGMTFVGADIGGFFKNPDAQLMARWFQAAAFVPFMRNHAHIDTRRREPWLFDEQSMFVMRDAVRARYTFLPFWYTLFFHANQTGAPLMRPLWYEFPKDSTTFGMDDEYLLGNALLVKPVTEENAKQTEVYFPGDSSENWHDISSLQIHKGGTKASIDTPLQKIPVFQRGGTIIPRRFRVRRSSILAIEDPITLSIALNDEQIANGSLYLDDGITRNHLEGDYVFAKLELKDNLLKSRVVHPSKKYQTKVWLERVYITGFKFKPSGVEIHELPAGERKPLEFFYDETNRVLTVRKPGVNMGKGWAIVIRP
ncbi:Neutral alpha-glucosidase AB [Hypsibius exemplaris]|uniref:Glucosidase II subunit alpha n=1 Tax=Hypsibius exemplaris TaxID=2072580 RepID=A0A1W0WXI1_HYPEX|nr:Neutral alpha-glucosidase AB [Hypsibius exemplaris]